MNVSEQELRYMELLAKRYPSIQKASTEIINLKAILSLPKGTEHFLSDLHGEYEAFTHLLNSASGVIKKRINEIFKDSLRDSEKNSLATLIYYPEEKTRWVMRRETDLDEWYKLTLHRLIKVCRSVSSKYTRSKVRKTLPKDFAYVIEELLHEDENELNKQHYYDGIIDTIISTGRAREFIIELCILIRKLTIDRLHIVGDIFDRGPHPDLIIETLMLYKDVDIQWGNHDVVWMGAAMGSLPLIATLLRVAARYDNLSTVEDAYGVNLLPLATFAMQVYKDDPCTQFQPKLSGEREYRTDEIQMVAQMHKAISIIQFKLEGQLIKRRPEFKMDDRLLLEHIDYEKGTIRMGRKVYPLLDTYFPTIDPVQPYQLTVQEQEVMERLRNSFQKSQKIQRHVKYLLNKGSMYLKFNSNLLYHGCIPMTPEGEFKKVKIEGSYYAGKALLDKFDEIIRQCYYYKQNTGEDSVGIDYMYYLWPGPDSPLFGKTKMATFERYFIADKETHIEEKNPYFTLRDQEELSIKILNEFSLDHEHSRIVNGHVPVKFKKGEDPVKGNGRMIVIDGGLAKAYQPETGIAGYTLIYNSYGLMLAAHEPFESKQKAIELEKDIISDLRTLEKTSVRKRVGDTDIGVHLRKEIKELEDLLVAYRKGYLKEENGNE
ncbi:MAG: fructose 1,6-bisphosphatase [Bacteroidetes bacterium GWA2_40_14]|jgi:fructose-1,6-bisphosphatase-3|nr:MAG: fructose 1,6-bisphosphatase [Bacteroidetes bacterium GWA2_40_14]HAZ02787.1 class 3 fructose-bisphosphatase [Marinilabiliales bacterium]